MGTDGRLDSRRRPIRGPASMSRPAHRHPLRDDGRRGTDEEDCLLRPLHEITAYDYGPRPL